MKACANRQAKQALEALFRGELDAEGFTRLRAHVDGCDACREAYEKLARVEQVLEKRALPEHRQALLERELFARLAPATPPARAPSPSVPRWRPRLPEFLLPTLAGLALASVALLVAVPRLRARVPEDEWQSRGGPGPARVWGVRAFCVGQDGVTHGEARPGGTLVCGEGSAVQFSYTAPEAARLEVEATSPEGEPLRFFPPEGDASQVAAGVDVPLPYSTPVQRGWLHAPLEVRARFTNSQGQELSLTRLTLSPR